MSHIISHRGYTFSGFKENTIHALKTGLELSDGIEFDIRLTRDKKLIVFHDSTIKDKKIMDLTFQEIISNIKDIPLLENILDLYIKNNKLLNIELKDNNTAILVEQLLLDKGFEKYSNNILISSFIENEYNLIKNFNKALLTEKPIIFDGNIICDYSFYNKNYKNIIGVYTPNNKYVIKEFFDIGLIVITDNPLMYPD